MRTISCELMHMKKKTFDEIWRYSDFDCCDCFQHYVSLCEYPRLI